ncbi:hypothetical protein [Streptomyces colonosanans]|uniref:hypothetical protein n=1 Tax=Streptomyces colonosanans TaxID=1428652 RepID=UPI000AA55C1D|nr:hypothetical protein [Streptomyces colonosanans]
MSPWWGRPWLLVRQPTRQTTAPGGTRGLIERTYLEALLNTFSIAQNNGDSDPDMDEALRRVRQGR